jgi:hypothetical protein
MRCGAGRAASLARSPSARAPGRVGRLAGREEGGECRFLLCGQLQLGAQLGGMLGLACALGVALGLEGCALLGAHGLAMAAFWTCAAGWTAVWAMAAPAKPMAARAIKTFLADGVHFRVLWCCEAVGVCI